MRTNILSFVLSSENRKKIVQTLLEYPRRQWSCSALEDITRLSHPTVFRTLQGLVYFGLLKSLKINRKDLLYQLVKDSLWIPELEKILYIEKITAAKIAVAFVRSVKSLPIKSIVLYGSAVKGNMATTSDIDILIIIDKKSSEVETKIFDRAGELSSKFNRTISPTIMTLREINQEKKKQFIVSVRENMEVLYGKASF
ncbi:nucleotidyltransferase domain-containing protein [Candidatus Woesearchaeota archaeon]|nr:nucleotidyltransferase domain-containing protein [Candidatus Woesearchaeota archaeon]